MSAPPAQTWTPPTRAWAARRVAQVLAAAAAERLHGVPARTADDVPRSPADAGPEWLTAVLCRHQPAVRVVSAVPLATSHGTTTRRSLALTYDGGSPELPDRVFVKCTATPAQRLMLGLGGLIHGEPGFYMHVRPGLEIEAPAGWFGAVDARSWRSVVVMEDVTATRGAHFWEPGTAAGVSRAQIEDLLGTVAAWHGALWDSPQLTGWRWLRTPREQMRLIDALIGLANRLPAGAARARAVLPAGIWERRAHLLAGMRRSMQLLSEGPHTYLHGDLHIANTYVTRTGRIGVADWQVGLRGSWAYDVAYLLATALEVDERRAWERDLVALYLQRLGAAGGDAIPFPDAWLAYRRSTFYPLFAWLYTIGRSRLQPHFQPDAVSLTMIRRIASAMDDLGSFAAVTV